MPSSVISFSPSLNYEEALSKAADLWGIDRQYWDIWGKKHIASPEGVRAVLESVGVAAGTTEDLDRAVEERLWIEWSRFAPPACELTVEDPAIIVRIPSDAAGATLGATIRWEDGGSESFELSIDSLEAAGTAHLRGSEFQARRLRLPFKPRLGYHELEISVDGRGHGERPARL